MGNAFKKKKWCDEEVSCDSALLIPNHEVIYPQFPWNLADIQTKLKDLNRLGNLSDLAAQERRPFEIAHEQLRKEWLETRRDPRARCFNFCHRAVERGLYRQLQLEKEEERLRNQPSKFTNEQWNEFWKSRNNERNNSIQNMTRVSPEELDKLAEQRQRELSNLERIQMQEFENQRMQEEENRNKPRCDDPEREKWLLEAENLGKWLSSRGRSLAIPAPTHIFSPQIS